MSLGFLHHTSSAAFEAVPTLEVEIRQHQKEDEKLQDDQGTLWYKNRICVPEGNDLRKLILSEAHDTAYSIHPGNTKMLLSP